jgi:hypothetical protein
MNHSNSHREIPHPLKRLPWVCPSQLLTWRRMAREGRFGLLVEAPGLSEPSEFVPLIVEGGKRRPRPIGIAGSASADERRASF